LAKINFTQLKDKESKIYYLVLLILLKASKFISPDDISADIQKLSPLIAEVGIGSLSSIVSSKDSC